jgi:Vitamin K-dependent gamma-carboxylase
VAQHQRTTTATRLSWLAEGWDRFFFQPADALPLSVIRILAGSMLLYTHLVWGSVLENFLGPDGWNSEILLSYRQAEGWTPSLWWHIPVQWMLPVHWCCNLIIVMLILGLGGRLVASLTWFIALSYAQRSELANFGLDQVNCLLTLYLCVGPANQYLSLDRWIAQRLGRTEQLNQPSITANVSLRLIQLHLCIIYLWAGLGKLQGEAWWTGESVWRALANYEYQSWDLTWLANLPRLLELLTHATIAWELSFCCLVWPKSTRWIVLLIGAGMHFGIGAFLGMWTFGSIMIFAYTSFAEPNWLRSLLSSVPGVGQSTTQADTSLEVSCGTEQYLSSQLSLPSNPGQLASGPTLASLDGPITAGDVITNDLPIVVVITSHSHAAQLFMDINRNAHVQWVVVSSLKQAEPIRRTHPDATFLLVEPRTLDESGLIEYLCIRPVTSKKPAPKATKVTAVTDQTTFNSETYRSRFPK